MKLAMRAIAAVAAGAALVLGSGTSGAQNFPAKAVRISSVFPTGLTPSLKKHNPSR